MQRGEVTPAGRMDLRTPTLAIIASGSYPRAVGEVIQVSSPELGELEITATEKGIHFAYTTLGREMVLGVDGVLVEKVKYSPTPADSGREITPLEIELAEMVRSYLHPDTVGKTNVIKPRKGHTCYLTRTKTGVVADFWEEGRSFFYDLGSHRVRSYYNRPDGGERRQRRVDNSLRKSIKISDPVEQRGYDGQHELVNKVIYNTPIKCTVCGETRWVKPCDKFQVTLCKPCKKRRKLDVSNVNRKNRRAKKGAENGKSDNPE